jgi:hypothetical protein
MFFYCHNSFASDCLAFSDSAAVLGSRMWMFGQRDKHQSVVISDYGPFFAVDCSSEIMFVLKKIG